MRQGYSTWSMVNNRLESFHKVIDNKQALSKVKILASSLGSKNKVFKITLTDVPGEKVNVNWEEWYNNVDEYTEKEEDKFKGKKSLADSLKKR